MSKCIIYASSSDNGGKYLREAERSALSFRKYIPDAHFLLYTNCKDYKSPAFDEVKYVEFKVVADLDMTVQEKTWLCGGQLPIKMQAMQESEYDHNLYIGSDTLAINSEVACLFDVLDRFDIAVSHAPFRVIGRGRSAKLDAMPNAFPEFNGDLILFRKSSQVRGLMKEWKRTYELDKMGHPHDQGALRYLLYASDLRIATLPPEFNYRGRGLRDDIVIIQNRELIKKYVLMNNPGNYFKKAVIRLFNKVCLFCDPIKKL